MKYFTGFGRDIEKLVSKVKIAHSRRVFCLDKSMKRIITNEDIENGYKLYKKHIEDVSDDSQYAFGMFT